MKECTMTPLLVIVTILLISRPNVAIAQDDILFESIVCPTSDGNITITPTEVRLRDYRLSFDSLRHDRLYLRDRKNGVLAQLIPSYESLDLVINEKGRRLAVVIHRNAKEPVLASRYGYPSDWRSLRVNLVIICLTKPENSRSLSYETKTTE